MKRMHLLRRRLFHALFKLRFRLFEKRRMASTTFVRVAGVPLVILPGVMNPVLFRTGAFFAQHLDSDLISPETTVLDMGTGCGVTAIFAARFAHRVVAVDVSPTAVRCARTNVFANNLEKKIIVRQGNLFGAVQGQTFDVILFNPPYFSGEPRNDFEKSLYSDDIIPRFLSEACWHLCESGHILLAFSDFADLDRLHKQMKIHGFTSACVGEKDHGNERLFLFQLEPVKARSVASQPD